MQRAERRIVKDGRVRAEEGARESWAKRNLARQWWLYGLLLAAYWVARSLSRGYSPLVTWIGVVPAFVLGTAALVMRRRREARAIGGGIDMDDLPELEKMVTRRQVPEDVTQRRQALALVHWRQHRSRRTWPFGLAAVTVVYLALGIVLALAGHRAAGIVFAVLGLLVIGGGGYLLVRFGQRRMERYEAQLGAAH